MSASKAIAQNTKVKASSKSTVAAKAKQPTVSKQKEIKYSDKSEGQPGLAPIFNDIKRLMKDYVKGTIEEQDGKPGTYGLISKKAVEVEGRRKDEIYFAGLMVQKGYVGFYFMPVYTDIEVKKIFKPELLKCLKGKSCFHIKKHDLVIMEQIEDALKAGYKVYKDKGWINP